MRLAGEWAPCDVCYGSTCGIASRVPQGHSMRHSPQLRAALPESMRPGSCAEAAAARLAADSLQIPPASPTGRRVVPTALDVPIVGPARHAARGLAARGFCCSEQLVCEAQPARASCVV